MLAAASTVGPSCPAPESVVPGGVWHLQTLAPGILLYDGKISDNEGAGRLRMHVLRIDVTHKGVSVQPLIRSLTEPAPLTQLASSHKHLFAAVNTGYFDFVTGAPTQPLIVDSRPLVISALPRPVIGFDAKGALQWGAVSLSSKVFAGSQSHPIRGINDIAARGVVPFTADWGSAEIPLGSARSLARLVVGERLSNAVAREGGATTVPSGGFALVAHGQSTTWLSKLPTGSPVRISNTVVSTSPQPFMQAYGVGTTLVEQGKALTGLACSSAGTKQPARTAIGIADDKRTLVIGEVEEHPGTDIHGLDEDQMAAFMAQLGVDRAWDLDGSGSTELLARMPGTTSLSLRTYPADGEERPMPVGLGIAYRAPPHTKSAK
jgi:hypothetical protein